MIHALKMCTIYEEIILNKSLCEEDINDSVYVYTLMLWSAIFRKKAVCSFLFQCKDDFTILEFQSCYIALRAYIQSATCLKLGRKCFVIDGEMFSALNSTRSVSGL